MGVALLSLLLVFGLFVGTLFGLDLAYRDHVFKGLSVAGVYLGGLSRGEAEEKLRGELDLDALNSNLSLVFEDRAWDLPLYRIGAYVDIEASVDQALAASREMPFYRRWLKRLTFGSVQGESGLVVRYEPLELESFLKDLQASIDCEPVSASIRLEGGKLVFTHSREGWKLDVDAARRAILEGLTSTERKTPLTIAVAPPEVRDEEMGKVITVDLSRHQLTLYSNMQVEKQYPIACGMPAWPTPKGTWKVTAKLANPTWVNPGTSWAATMPPYIPPGPGNPLGTRALATSAPGVLIHGTYSSWSIGTSASHGCIRMYIKDSEDIFTRVEVGTPVLIY
jgi:lipoprotein-anchoring transpeptidase ErfK/SrfK